MFAMRWGFSPKSPSDADLDNTNPRLASAAALADMVVSIGWGALSF